MEPSLQPLEGGAKAPRPGDLQKLRRMSHSARMLLQAALGSSGASGSVSNSSTPASQKAGSGGLTPLAKAPGGGGSAADTYDALHASTVTPRKDGPPRMQRVVLTRASSTGSVSSSSSRRNSVYTSHGSSRSLKSHKSRGRLGVATLATSGSHMSLLSRGSSRRLLPKASGPPTTAVASLKRGPSWRLSGSNGGSGRKAATNMPPATGHSSALFISTQGGTGRPGGGRSKPLATPLVLEPLSTTGAATDQKHFTYSSEAVSGISGRQPKAASQLFSTAPAVDGASSAAPDTKPLRSSTRRMGSSRFAGGATTTVTSLDVAGNASKLPSFDGSPNATTYARAGRSPASRRALRGTPSHAIHIGATVSASPSAGGASSNRGLLKRHGGFAASTTNPAASTAAAAAPTSLRMHGSGAPQHGVQALRSLSVGNGVAVQSKRGLGGSRRAVVASSQGLQPHTPPGKQGGSGGGRGGGRSGVRRSSARHAALQRRMSSTGE